MDWARADYDAANRWKALSYESVGEIFDRAKTLEDLASFFDGFPNTRELAQDTREVAQEIRRALDQLGSRVERLRDAWSAAGSSVENAMCGYEDGRYFEDIVTRYKAAKAGRGS